MPEDRFSKFGVISADVSTDAESHRAQLEILSSLFLQKQVIGKWGRNFFNTLVTGVCSIYPLNKIIEVKILCKH